MKTKWQIYGKLLRAVFNLLLMVCLLFLLVWVMTEHELSQSTTDILMLLAVSYIIELKSDVLKLMGRS